jgi:alanine racemase
LHIEVETGMNPNGFEKTNEQVVAFLKRKKNRFKDFAPIMPVLKA